MTVDGNDGVDSIDGVRFDGWSRHDSPCDRWANILLPGPDS